MIKRLQFGETPNFRLTRRTSVRHVRAEEFSDIRNYPTPSVVRDVMMFGTPPEAAQTSPMPTILGLGFIESIDMIAAELELGVAALEHALGALDGVGQALFLELADDERLEEHERHLLRQAALVQLQLRPDDEADSGECGSHSDDGRPKTRWCGRAAAG